MRPEDAQRLRTILLAQLPETAQLNAILQAAGIDPRATSPMGTATMLWSDHGVPVVNEPALRTVGPATPTPSPPQDAPSGSDGSTPTTTTHVVIDPLLHEETSIASETDLPTPSATASPPLRAPSPTANWIRKTTPNWMHHAKDARVQRAKDARYKISRIFDKTRPHIRHNTRKMGVLSTRGFQRNGYAPTKRTTPPFLKRRYSVDIFTKDWEKDSKRVSINVAGTCSSPNRCTDNPHSSIIPQRHEEHEPAVRRPSLQSLPDPLRYQDFSYARPPDAPPEDFATYLSLGDIVLENTSFRNMLAWCGDDSWMDDGSVNTALEALCRLKNCRAHLIDMFNSNFVQVIYPIVQNDNPKSPKYVDPDHSDFDCFRDRYQDKKWIFVPINDGVGSEVGSYNNGSHWSLVIMDRVHKLGYYYDSMGVGKGRDVIGCETLRALVMVLQEDLAQWRWRPQANSPDQSHQNLFPVDTGPCGPFVWKMTHTMIDKIIVYQMEGRENECILDLEDWFPAWFGSFFNSLGVRHEMQDHIVYFRRLFDAQGPIEEHDRMAVTGEEVVVSEELPAVFWPPSRRVQPTSDEIAANGDEEKDSSDTDNLDWSSEQSTVRSEPADDIRLSDDEAMTGIDQDDSHQDTRGNDEDAVQSSRSDTSLRTLDFSDDDDEIVVNHRQVQRATSRRTRSTTPGLEENIGSLAGHCDSHRRWPNSVESDSWSKGTY